MSAHSVRKPGCDSDGWDEPQRAFSMRGAFWLTTIAANMPPMSLGNNSLDNPDPIHDLSSSGELIAANSITRSRWQSLRSRLSPPPPGIGSPWCARPPRSERPMIALRPRRRSRQVPSAGAYGEGDRRPTLGMQFDHDDFGIAEQTEWQDDAPDTQADDQGPPPAQVESTSSIPPG